MEFVLKASLSEELKSFVQSGNYEPYILALMNKSKTVFPGQYGHYEKQHHSQCDFYDLATAEKYEAKLPFDKTEGKLLCSNSANLKNWIEYMMDEEAEFGEHIIHQGESYKIEHLRLYKTLEKRLNTVQEDENAIFFFPYPITLDLEEKGEVSLLHFCGDILSSIFRVLVQNDIIRGRKVYAIYPSADRKIVLRCLNTNQREYLISEKINSVFSYRFFLM